MSTSTASAAAPTVPKVATKPRRHHKRGKDSMKGYLGVLARDRLHKARAMRSSAMSASDGILTLLVTTIGRAALECMWTISSGTQTLSEQHVRAALGVLYPNVVDVPGDSAKSTTIYGDQIWAECATALKKYERSFTTT